MLNLNPENESREQMRALDDQSWVSSWLWSTDQDEYIGDVSELGDFTVCEPATPRRQSTPTYEDDLSPTNTSFSDNSIFDPSDAKRDPWFDDPFADDVPDLAPADNDGQTVISKVRWLSADLAAPPVEIDRSDNTSDLLVEPPTELAHDEQHEADSVASTCTTAVNVRADPDDPRIARITSCAQCIVANLPCSRTYPCCTRCKRNGHAKLCLLHRMRFLEELDEDKLLSCTIPVLLKVKNEDEAILQQKIEFLKELEEGWQTKEDKKNWVLPSLDGLRGGLKDCDERAQRTFPGEGKGPVAYKELHVVLDA